MSLFGDTVKGFFNMGGYDEYDEYDDYDEYDSEEEVVPVKPAKPEKKKPVVRQNVTKDVEEEDFDDFIDKPTKSAFAKRPSSRQSKVVQMNNERNRNIKAEIFTIKPTSLDDSKEIVDTLLEGKAVVVNFEGVNTDMAQRVIDNICGACCAINGTLKKVSAYIYIVAPVSIELYGDYSDASSAPATSQYSFKNRYQY